MLQQPESMVLGPARNGRRCALVAGAQEVVAPLVRVDGWSFPSGHALASAVVYLTLGALIAANVQRRAVKIYVVSVAFALTCLVGVSRVLLGEHYPTGVLAGWMACLAWALMCWVVLASGNASAHHRLGRGDARRCAEMTAAGARVHA